METSDTATPAVEPMPSGDQPWTRAEVFALVAFGIAAHELPTPLTVDIHDHNSVSIRTLNGDTAGVDAWARYLGLSLGRLGERVNDTAGIGKWSSYGTRDSAVDNGRWTAYVWTLVRR